MLLRSDLGHNWLLFEKWVAYLGGGGKMSR